MPGRCVTDGTCPHPLGQTAAVAHDHADDLALALRLADAADEVSRPAFTGVAVPHELKADGSPVSATDIAVERRISEVVAAERPADGVLGEEVGESGPAGRRWILDGIDGTVLFVAGVPGWATQIALEVDGEPVVGVTASGGDGRRWWAARGAGAWRRTAPGAPAEPLAVSDRAELAGSRYSLIPPLDALSAERQRLVAPVSADGDVRPALRARCALRRRGSGRRVRAARRRSVGLRRAGGHRRGGRWPVQRHAGPARHLRRGAGRVLQRPRARLGARCALGLTPRRIATDRPAAP